MRELAEALKRGKEGLSPGKKKCERAKRMLGKRNGCSKTDEDATFMRMKEDQGKTTFCTGNGRLKPGCDARIGTEGGFALGYDMVANPADTRTLKARLRRRKKRLWVKPKAVTADGGYGSEENYNCLESQGIAAVVKRGMRRKEGAGNGKKT